VVLEFGVAPVTTLNARTFGAGEAKSESDSNEDDDEGATDEDLDEDLDEEADDSDFPCFPSFGCLIELDIEGRWLEGLSAISSMM
jgi:hypothetical protein